MVVQNKQIIVQRGKDLAYLIVPLKDVDRLSVNDELIQTVQEAEAEYVKLKATLLVACGTEEKGLIALKEFSIYNPLFGSIRKD